MGISYMDWLGQENMETPILSIWLHLISALITIFCFSTPQTHNSVGTMIPSYHGHWTVSAGTVLPWFVADSYFQYLCTFIPE